MAKVTDSVKTVGYEGYVLYDEIEIELASQYFGINSTDNSLGEDGYVYQYIKSNKLVREEAINDYYFNQKADLDSEIKGAFELDVRQGKIDIIIDKDVQVIEISEYNRDYANSPWQIIDNRNSAAMERGTNSGETTNLNAIFLEYKGEKTMFIEGTNAEEDADLLKGDWITNFKMAGNVSKDEGATPKIYVDAYNYYQKYGDGAKIVVGNSQGGGSAVFIGLQDSNVQIVALSPAPQYVGDIDINGNYPNITVIYNSTDVLYNFTKAAGFVTEIPGANIAKVDYGLSKFMNFGAGSLVELLVRDLNAGHTGDISAVDYNQNGKLDFIEKLSGINIDDAIPKSVFTGDIIGTNTKAGEQLVISKEHMFSFVRHLHSIITDDITGIKQRNYKARKINLQKLETQDSKALEISRDLSETIISYSNIIGRVFFKIEDVIKLVSSRNFTSTLSGYISSLSSQLPLETTNDFLSTVLTLRASYENVLELSSQSFIVSGINILSSGKNEGQFNQAVIGVVQTVLKETAKIDYVGHYGKNAIFDTLDIVLKTLAQEIGSLELEMVNLRKRVAYVARAFDANDQEIAQIINDDNSIGRLSDAEELILSEQSTYLQSLGLTERMNVIEQYERLIEDGTLDIKQLFHAMIVKLMDILEWVLANKSKIIKLTNYEGVRREIEDLDNYLETEIIKLQLSPFNYSFTSVISLLKTQRATISGIKMLLTKYISPYRELLDALPEYLEIVERTLREITNIDQILVTMIEPRIESMLYDVTDLGVVRDSIRLNSQVLQRIQIEINQAMNTLNGNISFAGKESLNRFVNELALRITALSEIHQSIFGDV